MSKNNMESISIWMEPQNRSLGIKLKEHGQADVCVVGAGISGLTTAYLLAKEGKKVVVLDHGSQGSGQTSRTTAHLSNAIDDRYFEIERLHGKNGARLAAQSHTAAIDLIERICEEENIVCGFERVDGYLFSPRGQSTDILDRELKAAHRAGLLSVSFCTHLPISALSEQKCLKFPRQAQFDPLRYLAGLESAFLRWGGRLYSETSVTDLQGQESIRVITKEGPTITADSVVVATNTPINDRYVLHTKQAAYRTYALGFSVPKNSIPTALYWDTLDPYHYLRIHNQGERDFLIVGGEDHRTGQGHDERLCYQRLEKWAQSHFPDLKAPEFTWSGQIEETMDGLAYIGANPSDSSAVFVVTGDSGMGLTHGTIAGLLLTDLIQKRSNPWAQLYDPSRKTASALTNWLSENVNTAIQYADYFTPGEVSSIKDIPRHSGAIIRRGFEKLAVYRDESGTTHSLSAVCPHLGGLVRWNTAEKTWDCPCHGSRFSAEGKVLEGPAISDLPKIEAKNFKKKPMVKLEKHFIPAKGQRPATSRSESI